MLNLGTGCRLVVNITTRLLYSRYPLNSLGGLQGWSGCFGKKINLLPLAGHEPQTDKPVATPAPTDSIRPLYAGLHKDTGLLDSSGSHANTLCLCLRLSALQSTTRPRCCEVGLHAVSTVRRKRVSAGTESFRQQSGDLFVVVV